MSSEKRQRIVLTIKEKSEIVEYGRSNHGKPHSKIADHSSQKWNKPITRRSVGDILNNFQSSLTSNSSSKVIRKGKHSEMENILYDWFASARSQNIPITERILIEKAKQIGSLLEITEFLYSSGWVMKFKKQLDINSKVLSGESGCINSEIVNSGIETARQVVQNFSPENVFNCDETGLFYRMLPSRSLTISGGAQGTKKVKDRITILFCVNMTGSEILKPLVIGKSSSPRCFKNFRHETYVEYVATRKSWMSTVVFSEWLQRWNAKLCCENRKILLLIDNAPSHNGIPDLSQIQVHKLPPNTTSALQPCDAGIIASFKQHYRKYQLKNLIRQFDSREPLKIELSQAIRFTHQAWNDVSQSTIRNCWIHTKLANREFNLDENTLVDDASDNTTTDSPDQVGDFAFIVEDPIPFREFVTVDNNLMTEEIRDPTDMAVFVETYTVSEEDPAEDSEECQQPVSIKDAANAVEMVIRFMEAYEDYSLPEINTVLKIGEKI